jgi:hypothetical protein
VILSEAKGPMHREFKYIGPFASLRITIFIFHELMFATNIESSRLRPSKPFQCQCE